MHNYTGCMCLTFLHCVFLNVTSNCLPDRKQSHTDYICLTFLRCVFSCAASKRLGQNMHNHIGCICLASLHCVFSNVFSKQLSSNIYCFWNKLKLSKLLKSQVGHNNRTDITNINNANLDTLVVNIATLFILLYHHHYQYLCSNKCFFSAWVDVGRFIYTHTELDQSYANAFSWFQDSCPEFCTKLLRPIFHWCCWYVDGHCTFFWHEKATVAQLLILTKKRGHEHDRSMIELKC